MRIVIQKVTHAKVTVEGKITGSIKNGLLLLCGFENSDNDEDFDWAVRKILQMRIFTDADGKMNRSVLDLEGEILVVSQFTLHASTKKGNRPSFIYAAEPEKAQNLYNQFVERISATAPKPVQTGIFGAMMDVELCNNGPVTILLDSKNKE